MIDSDPARTSLASRQVFGPNRQSNAHLAAESLVNIRRGHRILVYGFDVLMLKQHVRQAAEWALV
jgi:hypothetical protein